MKSLTVPHGKVKLKKFHVQKSVLIGYRGKNLMRQKTKF